MVLFSSFFIIIIFFFFAVCVNMHRLFFMYSNYKQEKLMRESWNELLSWKDPGNESTHNSLQSDRK